MNDLASEVLQRAYRKVHRIVVPEEALSYVVQSIAPKHGIAPDPERQQVSPRSLGISTGFRGGDSLSMCSRCDLTFMAVAAGTTLRGRRTWGGVLG